MSVIKRARGAQWPLVQEYVFNYNDGVSTLATLGAASVDSNIKATVTDFGSKASPNGLKSGDPYVAGTNAASTGDKIFEMFALPVGAQIIMGDMQVEAPFIGPSTVTLAIGNQNSSGIYLAATTLLGAALGSAGTSSGAHIGNVVTLTVQSGHGVVAGNIINVAGVTGAGAAVYNGTWLVDSVGSTTIVYTNPNGATLDPANTAGAGTPLTSASGLTFTAGRTALTVPAEETSTNAQGPGAGANILGSLLFTGGQAATQGRVRVRVMYTIDGRQNEVSTT